MSSKPISLIVDFEINPEMISEGLTQSEMQCWDNCAEKWYLGYNLMLQLRGKFSWALTYGSWIHESLEEFYRTKGKRWSWDPKLKDVQFMRAERLVERVYWERLGQLQMEIYASHYKHDPSFMRIEATEEIIDIEFEGVRLKGMVDVYLYSKKHEGYYMMDHKTTGRLDKQTVLGWDFRLQFMFYCWLARQKWGKEMPVHGFFINAIKKPQLRFNAQKESLDGFLQRVQTDMLQAPEKYFYRERLRLKKGDLDHFEATILRPKLDRVRMLFDPKIPASVKSMLVRNKNTDYCLHYGQPCEFINACKNGLKLEKHAFRKREHKHMELAEEIGD